MKKNKKLLISIIALALFSLWIAVGMNPLVMFWFFLIILGYVLNLIVLPAYISIFYIDVLYPAVIVSTAASYTFVFGVKRYKDVPSKYLVLPAIAIFSILYLPSSICLAERHIKDVAISRYNQEAIDVKINLNSWIGRDLGDFIGLPGGNGGHGHAHGYIFINTCKSNWSFRDRDFKKGQFCSKKI